MKTNPPRLRPGIDPHRDPRKPHASLYHRRWLKKNWEGTSLALNAACLLAMGHPRYLQVTYELDRSYLILRAVDGPGGRDVFRVSPNNGNAGSISISALVTFHGLDHRSRHLDHCLRLNLPGEVWAVGPLPLHEEYPLCQLLPLVHRRTRNDSLSAPSQPPRQQHREPQRRNSTPATSAGRIPDMTGQTTT